MKDFCVRLQAARKKAGLSQEAASQRLDVRYSTYRRYERGGTEPTISVAARMAQLYGVSLDYLAGLTEQ